MAQKDKDLFLNEIGDVVPLSDDDRADIRAGARTAEPGTERRRLAALGTEQTLSPLTLPEQLNEVGPLDIVGDKKNGVQEGVYRKLRLGKYALAAKLDLHRIKVRDARDMVQIFLQHAFSHDQRTVLITHGKGIHSERPGVMKSYVIHWLQESELVLAWHSAQARHGGTGATYVLVRKSGETRQKNV